LEIVVEARGAREMIEAGVVAGAATADQRIDA
jgi:hypothetical protein